MVDPETEAPPPRPHPSRGGGLAAGATISLMLCVLITLSATPGGPLGAPTWWTWFLTGLQVLGLHEAGRRRAWGWLLGGMVQPPWITYAILTGQLGFIPGCVVSGGVQTLAFMNGGAATGSTWAGQTPGLVRPPGGSSPFTSRARRT